MVSHLNKADEHTYTYTSARSQVCQYANLIAKLLPPSLFHVDVYCGLIALQRL